MLTLDRQDLARLAADRGELRLSLFLSTQQREPMRRRSRTRGKNLIQQAGKSMRSQGIAPEQSRQVTDSALDALDDTALWRRSQGAVAVYAGSGRTQCFRLPLAVPELITFGQHYLVSPLLATLETANKFVALTLHNDEIGLYKGDESRLSEWLSSDLTLTELRRLPTVEPGQPADPAAVRQHLCKVDRALGELLRGSEIPLVLLGQQRLQNHYREVTTHPGPLLPTPGIRTGELSRAQIRRLACAATRVELRKEADAALESYHELRESGRTITSVEPLLAAAERAEVETLLVSTDAASWASSVTTYPVINLRDCANASYSVEAATATVLRHAGSVVTVARDRMPTSGPMAATLRE